jgi:phosphoglycerate dehydrogenase-like enzyme
MDLVPAQATVCNAYGHQVAVAEYVILGMLACAHNLVPIHAGFKKGTWYWSGAPVHVTHSEVFGKTLCIVGFGRIGRETATRAKALGMRVIACNRSAITHEPDLDRTFDLSKLAEAASRADFVLVSCALTNDTRNIIDSEVLAAMKATSVVINVGRGPLIHEEALYKALFERWIAGAVLDAWYRYPDRDNPQPPPSQFPFSQLDNVIMTPHISGWTDGMVDRRWAEMASNLDRFALGRPLVNVVRPAQVGRQDDAPAMA